MAMRKNTLCAAIAVALFGTFSNAIAAETSTNETAATATTTPTATTAPQSNVATRVASPFANLAGSQQNAVALANALRTGTSANLTYTSTPQNGETVQTTTEVTVPTKPMGWGNVSHALALAQYSLKQAGVDQPTAADLQAALNGGSVTNADGKTVSLDGVLTQRASGMGWGRIARTYGTTMGAVNRGIKAPSTTTSTSVATINGGTSLKTANGATPAVASSSKTSAPTTAAGATTPARASSQGITTAAGGTTATGTVGHGHGQPSGQGIVTATGQLSSTSAHGKGVVSGNGHAATGNAQGKGKGGG